MAMLSQMIAVIREEHHKGILIQARLPKAIQHASHLSVHEGDRRPIRFDDLL